MAAIEADYDLPQGRVNPDAGLFVEFDKQVQQSGDESTAAGRPIFKEVEYVRIIPVGDKRTVIHRPATELDKRRFRNQYERFKAGEAPSQDGTPLSEWPYISRSQVEELKYFKIHTLEQLANVEDVNLQQFMGGQTLKRKAREHLAALQANVTVAEIAQRDARIAALEAKLEKLTEDTEKED